jgi:L-ascorbate metabolism protein UlaG (beta-lactamase superfamily)
MNITWHGLSCFEIEAKTAAGNVTLVVDPYQNTTGLRFPRTLEAQAVAITHDDEDANNLSAVVGDPFVITTPGEYEVREVFVYGIAAPTAGKGKPSKNVIYRIETENMSIAHLGCLDRELTDAELQELSDIDILMIPVGGGRVMSPSVASEVIGSIEPRVVIPMTHGIPNVKEKLGTVDEFCKAFGVCRRESANKYKVSRKDLPEDDMLIMTLTR